MGQSSFYHATVALSFQIEICNLDRTKSSFLATSLYKKVIFTKNWVTMSCHPTDEYMWREETTKMRNQLLNTTVTKWVWWGRSIGTLWFYLSGGLWVLSITHPCVVPCFDPQCDGVSLDMSNGPSLEGIAVLNIPSIYGGSNLWGDTPSKKKQRKMEKKLQRNRERDGDSHASVGLTQSSIDLMFARQCKLVY